MLPEKITNSINDSYPYLSGGNWKIISGHLSSQCNRYREKTFAVE